jgi:hypothetical protein
MTLNNELEEMWKEAVLACFKALFWHMAWGSVEAWKTQIRITSVKADILTRHLPNRSQKCCGCLFLWTVYNWTRQLVLICHHLCTLGKQLGVLCSHAACMSYAKAIYTNYCVASAMTRLCSIMWNLTESLSKLQQQRQWYDFTLSCGI